MATKIQEPLHQRPSTPPHEDLSEVLRCLDVRDHRPAHSYWRTRRCFFRHDGFDLDDHRQRQVLLRIALPSINAHGSPTMGDKSPKSMRKRDDQKQTKTTEDSRKKQAAATAKQVQQKKK